MEWEEVKKFLLTKHFVNYKNELVIYVRLHFDAISESGGEALIKFRHDFKAKLRDLGLEKGSEELNQYVQNHLSRIEEAFRSAWEEFSSKGSLPGNFVDFFIEGERIVRDFKGEPVSFKELKPSKG